MRSEVYNTQSVLLLLVEREGGKVAEAGKKGYG